MFGFFSTRLGCAGSLLVSVVLSAILMLLTRGCSSPVTWWRRPRHAASSPATDGVL